MPAQQHGSHLPLKLNNAGVIPPIFALSVLLLPMTIVSFGSFDPDSVLGTVARVFNHGQPLYMVASSRPLYSSRFSTRRLCSIRPIRLTI
jgi:preprotein translocase subunit SecY